MGKSNDRFVHAAIMAVVVVSFSVRIAQAQSEIVIHSFSGPDGSTPFAGLIADSKGNGYGTTLLGGSSTNCPGGCGTVYKINTSGLTVLHSFGGSPASDGETPVGGLVMDKSGNLYGTTSAGGTNGTGTVFKLTPSGSVWNETILWNFGSASSGDGMDPEGTLAIDSLGNLYGTTFEGGINSRGTVFKVTPSGTESILYSFQGPPDGSEPIAGPILDKSGNLYGTTQGGGAKALGSVYEFSASGMETILHSFSGPPDGEFPASGLVFDTKGNLWGTAELGGAHGNGAVFEVTPTTETELVFYSFNENKGDGTAPVAGVIFDAKGNLYGTTASGSPLNEGIVYSLSPSAMETILHRFAGEDGATPESVLIRDSAGHLYGTTSAGGKFSLGTIYRVTP